MMNKGNQDSRADSFLGRVKPGMQVVGSGGQAIGSINQLDYPNLIVEVANGPLLHIPFNYIQDISQGKVRLMYTREDLESMRYHPSSQYEE